MVEHPELTISPFDRAKLRSRPLIECEALHGGKNDRMTETFRNKAEKRGEGEGIGGEAEGGGVSETREAAGEKEEKQKRQKKYQYMKNEKFDTMRE